MSLWRTFSVEQRLAVERSVVCFVVPALAGNPELAKAGTTKHIRLSSLLLAFFVVGLCGCVSKSQIQEASKASASHAGTRVWQGHTFEKVVGYRFADSHEWAGVLRPALNQVDMAHLQKMKRNEAVLSEPQIDQLMDAIFGRNPWSDSSLCYEPHHIFIFFAKDQPVGAFEFCLKCRNYSAWPERRMQIIASYQKLATLCRQLGLGVKPPAR